MAMDDNERGMTTDERVSLEVHLDAMRLAVETLFAEVPSGLNARKKFMERLHDYAQAPPHEGQHSTARLAEYERWTRRN